jgi:hypothetical protein
MRNQYDLSRRRAFEDRELAWQDAHRRDRITNISEETTISAFERNTKGRVLDILLRHLVSNVIRLSNRERDNRQRGIFRCAGSELTAIRNE